MEETKEVRMSTGVRDKVKLFEKHVNENEKIRKNKLISVNHIYIKGN